MLNVPSLNLHSLVNQHPDNSILQANHVHLDVSFELFTSHSTVPISAELMPRHDFCYGFGVIHRITGVTIPAVLYEIVTAIPCASFLEAHVVFGAHCLDFILCKDEKGSQITGIGHGKV